MKWLTFNVLFAFLFFGAAGQPGGGVAGDGAAAQPGIVRVMPGVNLPMDSVGREQLVLSLEGWLGHVRDTANAFMAGADRAATRLLQYELWNMERNAALKDTGFYRCYLTNAINLNAGDGGAVSGDRGAAGRDSGQLLVQFSYIGVQDGRPLLRASFEVIARRNGDGWVFSSPLAQYTLGWKSVQVGNCLFHFKTVLNMDKARAYEEKIAFFDQQLKAPPSTLDFYSCDDLVEACHLIGVGYKLDYSGIPHDDFSASHADHTVVVNGNLSTDGFNHWDPHDTWHDRLHRVLSTRIINRPVDEGSAYLFGGSWQVYTWADILGMMKTYAGEHPDADWLSLYKDAANLVPPPKIIRISYAINALIIQQLDKEGRWPAVIALLGCGPKEPGDANYFAALKNITGVDTTGFNAYVWGLVRAARSH